MFGNRLGWGLSVILSAIILLVVWGFTRLDSISAPTTGIVMLSQKVALNLNPDSELLEPIKLPADPLLVLPSMTDPTDAAPIYREAMAEYDKDVWAYEPSTKTGLLKSEDLKDLPAVVVLLKATNRSKMMLFSNDPTVLINYDMEPPPILKLEKIGKACIVLGLSNKANKDQAIKENHPEDAEKFKLEAIKYYEAAFSLGCKLVAERVRSPEFSVGWELMVSAARGIERVDPSRTAARDFADACAKYHSERIKPLFAVIPSIDPNVIGRTAGDVFYIAKNSKERMWRVEAILKLGRYRIDAGEGGRRADQHWAGIWVKRIAADEKEDPIIREAAKRARDLTLEEYRMIH